MCNLIIHRRNHNQRIALANFYSQVFYDQTY